MEKWWGRFWPRKKKKHKNLWAENFWWMISCDFPFSMYWFLVVGCAVRFPGCVTSHPIASMYGIFTYIYHKNQPNVGKYTIHGSYGHCTSWLRLWDPWIMVCCNVQHISDLFNPKDHWTLKTGVILRTLPLLYRFVHPSIGGSKIPREGVFLLPFHPGESTFFTTICVLIGRYAILGSWWCVKNVPYIFW